MSDLQPTIVQSEYRDALETLERMTRDHAQAYRLGVRDQLGRICRKGLEGIGQRVELVGKIAQVGARGLGGRSGAVDKGSHLRPVQVKEIQIAESMAKPKIPPHLVRGRAAQHSWSHARHVERGLVEQRSVPVGPIRKGLKRAGNALERALDARVERVEHSGRGIELNALRSLAGWLVGHPL